MCRCGITSRAARPFGPCPPGCHPTRSPQRLTSRASPSAGLAALALRRRPPAVRLNGSRPRGLRLRGAAPLTPPARARGRARPSAGREFPTLGKKENLTRVRFSLGSSPSTSLDPASKNAGSTFSFAFRQQPRGRGMRGATPLSNSPLRTVVSAHGTWHTMGGSCRSRLPPIPSQRLTLLRQEQGKGRWTRASIDP